MKIKVIITLFLVLIFMLPTPGHAKEQQNKIVESVNVNWWQVPVFAVDKSGNPIIDLGANDIEVTGVGKEHAIGSGNRSRANIRDTDLFLYMHIIIRAFSNNGNVTRAGINDTTLTLHNSDTAIEVVQINVTLACAAALRQQMDCEVTADLLDCDVIADLIVHFKNADLSIDGIIVEDPEHVAKRDAAIEVFGKVLVQQLALTPRKEVFIFVHGFHNDFNDCRICHGRVVALHGSYRCSPDLHLARRTPRAVRLYL